MLGEVFFILIINGYNSRIYARILNLLNFNIIFNFDWLRIINFIID
jgi:hypothetical protein